MQDLIRWMRGCYSADILNKCNLGRLEAEMTLHMRYISDLYDLYDLYILCHDDLVDRYVHSTKYQMTTKLAPANFT